MKSATLQGKWEGGWRGRRNSRTVIAGQKSSVLSSIHRSRPPCLCSSFDSSWAVARHVSLLDTVALGNVGLSFLVAMGAVIIGALGRLYFRKRFVWCESWSLFFFLLLDFFFLLTLFILWLDLFFFFFLPFLYFPFFGRVYIKKVLKRNLDIPSVIKIKFLHQCLWSGVMVIVLTVSPKTFFFSYFLSDFSYDFFSDLSQHFPFKNI